MSGHERNPLLELWRAADDQWAREWLEKHRAFQAWYIATAELLLEVAEAEKNGGILEGDNPPGEIPKKADDR